MEAAEDFSIRLIADSDAETVVHLIAALRVALAALHGQQPIPDIEAARLELQEYLSAEYPIYVAVTAEGTPIGYLVCRLAGVVVWVEQLFVSPPYRRCGVATSLFTAAERLSEALGEDTAYTWIHPNNDAMIAFLRSRGYTVLNLIEVRRPQTGELVAGTIKVGNHTFEY